MIDAPLRKPFAAADILAAARSWRLTDTQLLAMIRCDWRREVLGNGLVVLLHADPSTPLVQIDLGYRVGSMDEGPGQTGLAHLFEHLMFGGTKQLPGSFLTRMTQAGAANVNAMTMRDMTRYIQTVPTHLLDFALFAEADRMGNFLDGIDSATLERERKVVLEEKKQIEGKVLGKLYTWLAEGMLTQGHPYRHPVIGYAKDVAAFTVDDVRAWYGTHYAPSNAVLVVSGGIDPDAVLALVDRHFGHIPPARRPQRTIARVETVFRDSEMRVVDQIGVPGIFYQAWSTPSDTASPRASVALELASSLLGSGRSSVLHQCLVEERHLATRAASHYMPGQACGTFFVDIGLKASADREIAAIVSDAVTGFADTPVSMERMELLRSKELTATVRALGSFEKKARMLLEGEMLHGDPDWFREEATLTATIDESEIRGTVRDWLESGGFRLSIDPVSPAHAAVRPAPVMPVPGDAAAAVIRAPDWTEATLSNGVRVRMSPRAGDPTFQLRVSSDGGQAIEPVGMEGMTMLITSAPAVGVGSDDSAALADRAARASQTFGMGRSITSVFLEVGGLRGGLPSAMTLVADAVMRPRYDTPAFNRFRASSIANAATGAATPQYQAMNANYRALLGDRHRISAISVAPSLAQIGTDTIRCFHGEALRPQGTMILIAGDVDPADTVATLEAALADWVVPPMPALPPRLDLDPVRPGIRLFETSGQGTVHLTLLWRTRALNDAEEVALGCFGKALGGDYASRANLRLREEKGWTYGVQSGVGALVPSIGPHYGMIQTTVNESYVGEALAELEAIIAGMRGDEPVREAEIEQFRRIERDRMARLNETPERAVQTMQDMHDRGIAGAAGWLEHRDHVEGLSEDVLAALSADLLPGPGTLVCSAVGDVSRIRASLIAAGLGDRIVDEAVG